MVGHRLNGTSSKCTHKPLIDTAENAPFHSATMANQTPADLELAGGRGACGALSRVAELGGSL